MIPQPKIASVAFLIAEPARAAMLMALIDGRARPAGELAYAAGVTAQTASSHLAKLLAGGMISVESQGRHRYYRLANEQVAQLLEQLAVIDTAPAIRRMPLMPKARAYRFARCCYNHLAGQLGAAITHALIERGLLTVTDNKQYVVNAAGEAWFGQWEIVLAQLPVRRQGMARACLDWTEREHHLAGPLGTALLDAFCNMGWLVKTAQSRAVTVTPKGALALKRHLDIDVALLARQQAADVSRTQGA